MTTSEPRALAVPSRLVSINQFKRAVQLVDPAISQDELHRYTHWVFEDVQSTAAENEGSERDQKWKGRRTRDCEEILQRLEHCSCFMH